MGKWSMALVALAGLTLANLALSPAAEAATVKTQLGPVEGTSEDGLAVYRGIPFAAPPVGNLRWRAPAPAAKWSGTRDASKFAAHCIGNGPSSREDCLYLNVWSPAKSPGEKLPVMVWIYGGGFGAGSTASPAYSGEVLAKKGVVYVSISYRLGAIGFLAHPGLSAEDPHHVSGNYGLLDQIAALKWIQANIAAFGGDPKKVTIFGESAGGMAVSMLAASPPAKGLFRGAMSESGGSFGAPRNPPVPGENMISLKAAERDGQTLATRAGVKTVAELRALAPDKIAAAAGGGPPGASAQGVGVWPIIDGYVIPDDQYKLYQAGRFNETPILIGINSDEGVSFGAPTQLKPYVDQTRARYGPFADKLLAAYPATDDASAKQPSRDLTRDAAFGWHNWVWAKLQARRGKAKVYYYYFEQKPAYPAGSRFVEIKGVPHGAEIPFVFGHITPIAQGGPSAPAQGPATGPAANAPQWRVEDRVLSDQVVSYWTNFVKTGNPNGGDLPTWPAFTEAKPMVMHLHAAPAAGPVPNPAQLEALDGYFAWRRTQVAAGK
ncbi:MAG: carboxylesterase family protein [Caulobacteraceae bacterium]